MTICQALRVSGRECLPYSSGQLALCWTLVITWSERGSVQSWNSRHDLWMKWGQQVSGKTRDELDMTAVKASLEVWPHSFEGSFWNPIWKGVWPLDALLLSGVVLLLNRTLQRKLIYFSTPENVPWAKPLPWKRMRTVYMKVLWKQWQHQPHACAWPVGFTAGWESMEAAVSIVVTP